MNDVELDRRFGGLWGRAARPRQKLIDFESTTARSAGRQRHVQVSSVMDPGVVRGTDNSGVPMLMPSTSSAYPQVA